MVSFITCSSKNPEVPPVTIIVNPNVDNKYSPGKCGNQTVSCNNLIDVMKMVYMKVTPTLTSPSFNTNNQANFIEIIGVQFQIKQPLLNVNTVLSSTNIQISTCQFFNYNNKLASLISIESK
ncbi:hypothetical protein ACTA71_004552 [Dictyostelium dimigraforme]